MANLSNINNKFLVTTGGNVLIGQTSAVGSSIFQVTGNSTFAGNVNIGSSLSSEKLEVGGTIRIRVPNTSSASLLLNNTDTQLSIENTGGNMIFTTAGAAEKLRIDTSGNATFAGDVGIGISPNQNFHIFKSDATALIQASNTSGIAQLQFFPRDISNVAHLQSIKGVGSNLTFLTGGNSGNSYVPTERMRIDSSGDVTIQTSGADDIKNLTINSSNGSSQVAGFVIQNDGANGYIYFKAGAGGGTPTTKLTIGNAANSGNVGIGTTSPDYKLDVSGSIRAGRYTTNVYYYSTTNSASNQYFHIKTSVNANSQTCMHTWSVEGYAYGSGAIIDCKLAFHTDSGGNIYGKSYLGSLANNIYKSTDNYVVLVFGTVNTYYTHFYTNLFEGMYTTLNSTVLAAAYSPNSCGVY
ncbi:MAG: hypothetical protein H8E55_64465 [Pelagibacterales bacterium]|nr:hypothetical protein [Pelagibacterales bacterium]